MNRKNVLGAVTGVVVAALVCSGLAGCTTDDAKASSTSRAKTVTVRGWAYADVPLRNATLTIRAAGGDTVVRARRHATNKLGTFSVPATLPGDYRVTLHGGTLGDEVFTGRLDADVVGHGPSSGLIQVNALTTLLAAYRDRHPNLSPDRAEAEIRRFLVLPDAVVVSSDLRGNEQWFSAAEFNRQAQAAGGMQRFVKQLVAEMDARPARTHAFAGAPRNDIAIDLVKFVGGKVASTALSHLLDEFGLSEPSSAEIVGLLGRIQTQLTTLQVQMDAVSKQLTQVDFDIWATQVYPIANAVDDAFAGLQYVATKPPDKVAAAARVMSMVKSLVDSAALKNLNSAVMPTGSTGGYKAWSDLIRSKSTFWGPTQTTALMDYFDYIDTVQVELLYLLHEYAMATGISQDAFNNVFDGKTYTDNRTKQVAVRDSVTPAIGIVDLRSNLMWSRNAVFQFQKAWPDVPALIAMFNGNPGYPALGFNNWRLPTDPELRALVAKQTQPLVWLKSVWGAQDEGVFDLGQCKVRPGGCNVWSSNISRDEYIECKNAGPKPWNYSYLMAMETGKPVYQCSNTPGWVWPTRTMAPTEKYWL